MSIRFTSALLIIAAIVPAIAQSKNRITVPKIGDDLSLELLAALGVRSGTLHLLGMLCDPRRQPQTFPAYRPDRDLRAHWDWLQKPEPLVDAPKVQTTPKNSLEELL